MNLKEQHSPDKAVSSKVLFKGEEGKVISLQILKGERLKEHITKVPAMLICVEGEALFENEKGFKALLVPGNYVNIEPNVKHWVDGIKNSQLILAK